MTRSMSLLALALLVPACSLPVQERVVSGPAFTLTPDAPVAAFEVTLCIDGPKVKHAYVSATAEFSAVSTSTRPLRLDAESLDAPEDQQPATLHLSPGASKDDSLWMVAAGAFERGGRRCGEPEVLQFSVDALDANERIDVTAWDVVMRVEWEGDKIGQSLGDEDLSVEIVQL